MTTSYVISEERKGTYLGKTVQVVPHITDAIQDWIERVAKIPVDDSGEEPDVCIGMSQRNILRPLLIVSSRAGMSGSRSQDLAHVGRVVRSVT